jgi:hypothetical protein
MLAVWVESRTAGCILIAVDAMAGRSVLGNEQSALRLG